MSRNIQNTNGLGQSSRHPNLEDSTYFRNVMDLIAKEGLTDAQLKLALQTLVPEIHAQANALWDNSETEMKDCSLEIRGVMSVWPEWRKGIGKRVRFVYCVQSVDVDDTTFETHSLRAALVDAAVRLERRRAMAAFGE